MKRLLRLLVKTVSLAIILIISGFLATKFYFLPKTEKTIAETLRAAGYPKATAQIDTALCGTFTVTLFDQPETNIPFAVIQIDPWAWDKLRIATLTLSPPRFSPPASEERPADKSTAIASLVSFLKKDIRLPALNYLPYKVIEIESYKLILPHPYGTADGNAILTATDTGWKAHATINNPSMKLQGKADLHWSTADGIPHLILATQSQTPGEPPYGTELTYDGITGNDNSTDAIVSAHFFTTYVDLWLNRDKSANLAALPLSGELYLAQLTRKDNTTATATPSPDLTATGTLDLTNQTATLALAGSIATPQATIANINGKIALASLLPPVIPPKQEIRAQLAQINNIPLANPALWFSYKGDTLTIHSAQANTLGGKLSLSPLGIKPKEYRNQTLATTITLSDIDLAQTLTLGNVDGLSGTGTLSGSLPVSIDLSTGKLAFGHGTLTTNNTASKGKGTIAYTPASPPSFLAKGGQGEILAQVFSDFHYNNLKLQLEGTTGDTLTLNAKIDGSNPSFYNGHPVSFNLTLSGNLDTVLQQGLKGLSLTPEALNALINNGSQDKGKN